MNPAALGLGNRTTTLVLTALMLVAGLVSFQNLPRLEDPEFTIKSALVVTPYPGASAAEVEAEISDELERAVQQLAAQKEVRSKSDRGLSTVTVEVEDHYGKDELPQVWDELRRKVGDAQSALPPGAGPSLVVDDYGDVWGVFVAIYGAEYSPSELRDYAELVQRELLQVEDVAKVELWGERSEAVFVEPERERMAQLGIHPNAIAEALKDKSVVSDAGRVQVGPEFIAVTATGTLRSVEAFESLLIAGQGTGGQITLRDVATVRRGYVEPPTKRLRYDGAAAVGLGISTVAGGNVVRMGQAIRARMGQLESERPLGIEFGLISVQSQAVTEAIQGFVSSLVQAVVIVIGVLLLFMGWRSGLLIGFVLVLTISGTFIFMAPWGVALERISLGALIIALGMLVDNAIVVVDGMLVRMQRGRDPAEAAVEVVGQTALPLLGATVVAVLAFAAIGTSDDSTGEFCRSLYQVVLISLLLSWITAVTVAPVLGVYLLPSGERRPEGEPAAPGRFYARYRSALAASIRHRFVTVAALVGLLGVSLYGFRFVDQTFFPASTRPQFMVDLWLPQGTHIDATTAQVGRAEQVVRALPGVSHVTAFVGEGGLRFLLTYASEKRNSAYAQLLVDVDDYRVIEERIVEAERAIGDALPDVAVYGRKFALGPGDGGKLQVRLLGPDADVLRHLAAEVEGVFHADGGIKAIRHDWRGRVKQLRAVLAEEEANRAGVSRQDVAAAVRAGFEGERIGTYREGDDLLPILLRAPEAERGDVASVHDRQIWSPAAGRSIPLRQVVSAFETRFEDEIILRENRARTLTVHADPIGGTASAALGRVKAKIDDIEVPTGYALEWGGEYEDSSQARGSLAAKLPMFGLAMLVVVIGLFNGLRQPAAIFLCVPLAMIGVTSGLLATGQPFGFMALLGVLSLSGMLIKNAIVLIDEIELQRSTGLAPMEAILAAGESRLRPVAMAALTTALGMIPLLLDAFFAAMAVAIISGLLFATLLTMVAVPVFYAILFGVRGDHRAGA